MKTSVLIGALRLGAMVVILVAIAWAAGRAQVSTADFEIMVWNSPEGTSVSCIRGCNLVGQVNSPEGMKTAVFPKIEFSCGGRTVPCGAKINGLIVR